MICVRCVIQWVGYDDLCILSCEHCHGQCLCYLTPGRIGIVVKYMFIQ